MRNTGATTRLVATIRWKMQKQKNGDGRRRTTDDG